VTGKILTTCQTLTDDANSAGKSALCCFLDQIYGFSERFSAHPSTYLCRSVADFALRLFIRHCGADTGVTLEHFTDLGHSVGECFTPAVQEAMGIFPDTATDTFLFLPIRHLLAYGCDLEETDGFGRTALLASVESVKRSDFVEIANMLLQFRAVPSAVDHGDAGILHYILRTTSACNKAHTQQELFQPIKSLLVKLLLSRCNPNAVDENGHTPSDLALSPSAWMLWCDALHSAGLQPYEVFLKDDRINGIVLDAMYLERKYQEILKSWPPKWTVERRQSFQIGEDPPVCAYCGLPDDWTPSRPPFDFTGSYLVQMEDVFTHAVFANHKDGTFCANGKRWLSCSRQSHRKDGGVSDWSWKSLSLRKHVACRLWENKILSEPRNAYSWATGLSDDWITTVTD